MRETGGAERRNGARFALLLLVLPLAFASAGCNKFKSRQLIRKGNAYFKEQLYVDALKAYEEAQQLDPEEIRIDKFVAMGHMANYNPGSQHPKDLEALEKAIQHFKKYLAERPDDEKAAKYLVTTYMNSQRYDDAIAYFKDWFQKKPTDHQAAQTIAMLHAKKGEFDQSMEWQEKLAGLQPKSAEVFYTMGVTCWDKAYNTPPDGLTPEQRKAIVDRGMAALQKANELRTDYFEAMLYVNLLYREYAKLETDPAKKDALIAQATDWQKKALDARARALKKEREEAAAKNPLDAI